MKTRQVIGLSVLSSLLTVLAVLIVFNSRATAIAQKPASTPTPVKLIAPLNPDALTTNPGEVVQSAVPELPDAATATSDYQHVAGSAFTPLWNPAQTYYASNGCVYMTGTYKYLSYPLILPYRSTLTQLRLYYDDASAEDGILNLVQYDDGLSNTYLYTLTTAGSGGWNYTTIDVSLTPDYVNYSYMLLWRPLVAGSTMQLCGYRAVYTRPLLGAAALPLIQKNVGP